MKTTYLYAKQHNVTGMRYFGKTTQNPYVYLGSGFEWLTHLYANKNGFYHDVSTTWVMEYTDPIILEKEALFFSKVYDITNSPEWANQKPENGLDGWPTGLKPSEETCKKISQSKKGKTPTDNGLRSRIRSTDTVEKWRLTKKYNNKPIWNKGLKMPPAPVTCLICQKITTVSALTRYHLHH
jgi:hypothetical protein